MLRFFVIIGVLFGLVGTVVVFKTNPFRPQAQEIVPSLSSQTSNLLLAFNRYEKKSGNSAAIVQILELARERRDQQQALISSKSLEIVKNRVPKIVRNRMPVVVQSIVEEDVSLTGNVSEVIEDDFQSGKSSTRIVLRPNSRKTKNLYFLNSNPRVKSGYKIKIEGVQLGNDIVVTSSKIISTSTNSALGQNKKLAVILFDFQNDQTHYQTKSQVADVLFRDSTSMAAFYKEISRNKFTLDPSLGPSDVYGWYTIPFSNTNCDYYEWGQAAKEFAVNNGFNRANYDFVAFLFPLTQSCPWAGIAEVGNQDFFANGGMYVYVAGHELGHLIGANHAGSLNCVDDMSNPVPLSFNCITNTYGDHYGIMGKGTFGHNDVHRMMFQWFNPGEVQYIRTTGNYILEPNNETLLIGDFQLEYRKPWGLFNTFSANDPVTTGVTVRRSYQAFSQLLDLSPSEPASFDDFVLKPGQKFVDKPGKMEITLTQLTPNEAHVFVEFITDDRYCDRRGAPETSLLPQVNMGMVGFTLTYNLKITNTDSSNCAPAKFEYKVDAESGQAGWTIDPQVGQTEALGGGESVVVPIKITPIAPSISVLYFVVTAKNTTTSQLGSSRQGYYAIYDPSDTSLPQTTVFLPKAGDLKCPARLVGSFSDNKGVFAVEFWVDNGLVGTEFFKPATSGMSAFEKFWDCGTKRGNHRVFTRAIDLGGNYGDSTIVNVDVL